MNANVLIWDYNKKGLVERTDPVGVAASCDLWNKDIQSYGPWQIIDDHPLAEHDDVSLWQSAKFKDDPLVIICGLCSSSMDVAWQLIKKGHLRLWDSVIAIKQLKGRGQHQRDWISPCGNIYAAWVLPIPDESAGCDPKWQGLMSIVIGYTLVNVLETFGISAQIKWPNDLLLNDRKFGGILIENRLNHLVVGIGLNISYSPSDQILRNDFAIPATSLNNEGFNVTPLDLWLKLVGMGKKFIDQLLKTKTPDEFIKMVNSRMAWVNKEVKVKAGTSKAYKATISGLSEDGGLRLQCNHNEIILYSGSVIPI